MDILSTRPQFSALERKTNAQPDVDDVITKGEGEASMQLVPSVRGPMYVDEVSDFVKKWVVEIAFYFPTFF